MRFTIVAALTVSTGLTLAIGSATLARAERILTQAYVDLVAAEANLRSAYEYLGQESIVAGPGWGTRWGTRDIATLPVLNRHNVAAILTGFDTHRPAGREDEPRWSREMALHECLEALSGHTIAPIDPQTAYRLVGPLDDLDDVIDQLAHSPAPARMAERIAAIMEETPPPWRAIAYEDGLPELNLLHRRNLVNALIVKAVLESKDRQTYMTLANEFATDVRRPGANLIDSFSGIALANTLGRAAIAALLADSNVAEEAWFMQWRRQPAWRPDTILREAISREAALYQVDVLAEMTQSEESAKSIAIELAQAGWVTASKTRPAAILSATARNAALFSTAMLNGNPEQFSDNSNGLFAYGSGLLAGLHRSLIHQDYENQSLRHIAECILALYASAPLPELPAALSSFSQELHGRTLTLRSPEALSAPNDRPRLPVNVITVHIPAP